MVNRIIVHIGGEKTGSTAIQKFLSRNRDRLLSQGVAFLRSVGACNHVALAVYSQDVGRNQELRDLFGIRGPEDAARFRTRVEDSLAEEFAGLPEECTVAVVSNEHLQSRLDRQNEFHRLRELLAKFAPRTDILVYLRRQDRVANSAHSTRILWGRSTYEYGEADFERDLRDYYFQYDRLLENYSGAFGAERISVRIYDEAYRTGEGLIRSFTEALGLRSLAGMELPGSVNESLSAPSQQFLAQLNRTVPALPPPALTFRRALLQVLRRKYPGTRKIFDRERAETFLSHFDQGNQEVLRRYFPSEKGPLFDPHLFEYSDHLNDERLDFSSSLQAACQLWRELSTAPGNDPVSVEQITQRVAEIEQYLPASPVS